MPYPDEKGPQPRRRNIPLPRPTSLRPGAQPLEP